MAAIFKKVQALNGATINKERQEILGKDTTDSEATPECGMEQLPHRISHRHSSPKPRWRVQNQLPSSSRRGLDRSQGSGEAKGDEEEIIDFTVGREQEIVEDAQKAGELKINPVETTNKGSKDVWSPPKKRRRLRKGMVTTASGQVEKGAMAEELEVQSSVAEKDVEGKKKGKGKKVAENTGKVMHDVATAP
ncbi:hypothetical protein Dimus_018772 [Dionaea muscipula]